MSFHHLYSTITPHHTTFPYRPKQSKPSYFNLVSPCPNLSLQLLHILSSSPHHSSSTLFSEFSPHNPVKTFHHSHPAPRRTTRKQVIYMLSKQFHCLEQSILLSFSHGRLGESVKCGNFLPYSAASVDYSVPLIQSHVSYKQLTS